MKKFFVLLLCVVMFMAIFAELQAYGAGSYGKEVNFKPTSSSKKYSSDAADELGIILYQSSNETITSFEVACTLQRLLNEVSQTEIDEKSITKFKNYKEMANQKLVRQIYFVGALKVKNNRILVNTNCTRLEVARQFAYYDKYFKVYEQKKAVNLVDTKSAYAKYAYQAGLLDAPIRKFYPDTEITLEEFLDMLVRLQENSSVEIPLEAIQSSLVKSFKVAVDKENPVVGSSVKMNTNTQKYVDANVRNFDDIWTEDSRIAEVEAIDVTNLRICIKTHELDGKTRVFGSKNGKTEVLFELIVGTGIEYKKIELQSEVINVGDSVKMKYSYKGDEKLQWGSSDPSIVTVKDGVVTGVSVGTCEITCWSKSYIGTAKVVVEKNNLKISTNEVVLKVGKTFPIDVTYVGEPGMNYVSTSTEYDVAYEVDGVIYAVGKGVATITFKVNDGSSTQICKVIVK